MTEHEWLTCDDPAAMLRWMGERLSKRKLILFGCACCREWGNQALDGLVAFGERLADGELDEQDFRQVFSALPGHLLVHSTATLDAERFLTWVDAHHLANLITQVASIRSMGRSRLRATVLREQAGLLRDLVGNPFQALPLPETARRFENGLIERLAQTIYDERAFDRLPILGDALEEAGAPPALAAHCHAPDNHQRGCWVVDQVLGKD